MMIFWTFLFAVIFISKFFFRRLSGTVAYMSITSNGEEIYRSRISKDK